LLTLWAGQVWVSGPALREEGLGKECAIYWTDPATCSIALAP